MRRSTEDDRTLPVPAKVKRPPRGKICGVQFCEQITTKGKPFCGEHLILVERTEALIAEVKARDDEIKAVLEGGREGWRNVGENSSVAQDIMGVIEIYGPQTIAAIGRTAALKAAIVLPYVQALAARGLVKVTRAIIGRDVDEVVSFTQK